MSGDKQKKGLRFLKFHKKTENESLKLSKLWNGDQIPFSLTSCFAFVYYHNIDAKHVLRKNGNKVAQEVLYSYLKKNMEVSPTFYTSGVYDVCSAVKAYVKDIPEGLLVKELENDWHKLVRLNNETKVREKLMNIVQKLPPANKTLLFHILFLASAVTEHRQYNEMSTKSLSIVLMPSMFERVVDITKVRDLNGFYDLLEFMIENAKSIMGQDTYNRIETNLKEIGSRLHIVQQLENETTKLDEDKRVQFVSQDSGLNSTSFIDDKASQSLSSINRTNDSYDRSIVSDENISSMEDLLDSSGVISESIDNRQDRNIYRSTTIVSQSKTIVTDDSKYCALQSSDFRMSSSSLSSTEDVHDVKHVKQRTNKGLTCIGLKPHNIKECRPYSICGSPSLTHTPKTTSCQVTISSFEVYTPVYDRSFQQLDRVCDNKSSCQRERESLQTPSACNIQRKKPILKRSSCIIAPLERLSHSQSAMTFATSNSTTPKNLSRNESENTLLPSPTIPNLSKTHKAQIFLKQKLRIKRKTQTRLSVPIKSNDIDAPLLPSQRVARASSLHQSENSQRPLPQPLDSYLRQRSLEETFV